MRTPCESSVRFLIAAAMLCGAAGDTAGQESASVRSTGTQPPELVIVPSCHVSARETVEIPALERGSLLEILAEPGAEVRAGQVLGKLDDAEASLAVELARQELRVAEQKLETSRLVDIAAAAVEEAKKVAEQAEQDAAAACAQAEDDSAVRLAEKAAELARDVLERRRISRSLSPTSISEMEWFETVNSVEQAQIRLESAQQEQELAGLRSQSKQAASDQQKASLQRLMLQLDQARGAQETERLSLASLRTAVQIAEAKLQRRLLKAPFAGVVIDLKRFTGEWVESGESVLILMRRDRLTVEGFVGPAQSAQLKAGTPVRFVLRDGDRTAGGRGKLVFVSPLIDAVNQNVRVRAEVDSANSDLRAGEIVEMRIGERN